MLPAIADTALRIWVIGGEEGVRRVLVDPGKCLFHLSVLPVVAYLGLRNLPRPIQRSFRAKWTWVVMAIAVGLAGYFAIDNEIETFFKANTSPEDFRDRETRVVLLRTRAEFVDEMPSHCGVATPDTANEGFLNVFSERAGLLPLNPSLEGFLDRASFRRLIATYLAVLGAVTVGLVIICLLLAVPVRDQLAKADKDLAFVLVGLLAIWIPFRLLSNWVSFLGCSSAIDTPLVGATAACVVAIFLLNVLEANRDAAIFSVVSVVGSTVMTIGSHLKPDWLKAAGDIAMELPLSALLIVNALALIAFAAFLIYSNQVIGARRAEY